MRVLRLLAGLLLLIASVAYGQICLSSEALFVVQGIHKVGSRTTLLASGNAELYATDNLDNEINFSDTSGPITIAHKVQPITNGAITPLCVPLSDAQQPYVYYHFIARSTSGGDPLINIKLISIRATDLVGGVFSLTNYTYPNTSSAAPGGGSVSGVDNTARASAAGALAAANAASTAAASKVSKSGDTMTGPLVLPADPTDNAQAATKHYIDTLIAGLATTANALLKTNNLSDLPNASTARANLGLGSAATQPATAFDASGAAATAQSASLQKASNLSDLASAATARGNLGLGTAATQSSTAFDASGAATTAQSASLQKSSNLSDLASATTARANLGLGSAATQNASAFDAAGAAAAACQSNGSNCPTALTNGTTATTQAYTDNTTKVATDAFVQSVKATIPTTTTINTVPCSAGGSCTLPSYCAGAACANGSQIQVPFTTTSQLSPSANIAATDTSITVPSTAGYPSIGCGQLIDNLGREFACWSSTDGTHLLGLTRGYYGTSARAYSTAQGVYVLGISNSLSASATTAPVYFLTNTQVLTYGTYTYFPTAGVNNISGTLATYSLFVAGPGSLANASANISGGQLTSRSSIWNGTAPVNDEFTWTNVPQSGANPVVTYGLAHTGSSGPAQVGLPFPILGPATAPSGTCSLPGDWVFSRDGHATFCDSGTNTWTTKI